MKFGKNIHGPQRMNPGDFGDPLMFTSSADYQSKMGDMGNIIPGTH